MSRHFFVFPEEEFLFPIFNRVCVINTYNGMTQNIIDSMQEECFEFSSEKVALIEFRWKGMVTARIFSKTVVFVGTIKFIQVFVWGFLHHPLQWLILDVILEKERERGGGFILVYLFFLSFFVLFISSFKHCFPTETSPHLSKRVA